MEIETNHFIANQLHETPRIEALSVANLRCEGLHQASQVDTATPRFSWQLEVGSGLERDVRQIACQLRVVEADAAGNALAAPVESLRLNTDASQWIDVPGFRARPRAAYLWSVRVWDNHGRVSAWSEPHRFGTGLLGTKWPGAWISDGRRLLAGQVAPARHFRGCFDVARMPVRARLYVSALGVVEPWLNGHRVSEDLFSPGWPDYRRRVFYVAYDVTELLSEGSNTLGMILGDGWYSGTLMPGTQFGQEAMCSAFLDLTGPDGEITTVITDGSWCWTDSGPIRMNSIYDGETYDARQELVDWCDVGARDQENGWTSVFVREGWHGESVPVAYTARMAPAVRSIQTILPVSRYRRGGDTHIFDFGQNFAGWVRLRVREESGRAIRLTFAEMLEPDGSLHTANLRTAKATAQYIAKGEGVEIWEPRFTYFGFRYVELSGVSDPLPDAVTGVVLHCDIPELGRFECSHPQLNRLWANSLWGQKGNFLEVPTDCPQRDERVGWTGDAQVFAPTALYHMQAGSFFRQWLTSVRDGFRDDPQGGYSDIAPFTGFFHGSAGWAEAGVIVPWMVWLHTGDRRVLSENLGAIQHSLELMATQSPDGIRRSTPSYGDWLAPGFERGTYPPRYELIATAFFAYAADLAGRIADVLGRHELAVSNRALRDQVRNAFRREYIAADGRVADDVQTSYLLTLAFDLAPPELRPRIAAHLVRTIEEKGRHLATGFLGTPLILPVLTSIGRLDLAYEVLQQTTYPGWLFTLKNGATTVWERWDSWTPENGFHKDGMNSFNHYAYGSVVSWFYETIAGLQPLPESPGWKRFRIAPKPGGGITFATARVQTPYGEASSSWKLENGQWRLAVSIPLNSRAEVILPIRDATNVLLDDAPLTRRDRGAEAGELDSRVRVELPSGRYEFVAPVDAQDFGVCES